MNPLQVFWRTFAQMMAPFVVAALAVDWLTDYKLGTVQLFIGLIVSVLGAVAAAVVFLTWGPAGSAGAKAFRSFVEKLSIGLGAVVVNEIADIISLPRLLIPVLVGAVFAAVLTYLQNQGTPAPPPAIP